MNPWQITFTVNGNPVTKGSWKFLGRGHVVPDNPASLAWEAHVRAQAMKARLQSQVPQDFFLERYPATLSLSFRVPRPDSHVTVGGLLARGASAVPDLASSGDIDKLTRLVMDALAGVFYKNDAQVVWLDRICKTYATEGTAPGVDVTISFEG
jgi:Holliday junction resolvase RusA-like endonuclease